VRKNYQTIDAAGQAMAMPERVSVGMNEIDADVSEGLLALAVGAGLQVLQAMMAEDGTAACGPRPAQLGPGRLPARQQAGSVELGGPRGAGDTPPRPGRRRQRRTACADV